MNDELANFNFDCYSQNCTIDKQNVTPAKNKIPSSPISSTNTKSYKYAQVSDRIEKYCSDKNNMNFELTPSVSIREYRVEDKNWEKNDNYQPNSECENS